MRSHYETMNKCTVGFLIKKRLNIPTGITNNCIWNVIFRDRVFSDLHVLCWKRLYKYLYNNIFTYNSCYCRVKTVILLELDALNIIVYRNTFLYTRKKRIMKNIMSKTLFKVHSAPIQCILYEIDVMELQLINIYLLNTN